MNEGRQWVNDKIVAEKNLHRVKLDIEISKRNVELSRLDVRLNKTQQDETTLFIKNNDDFITRTKREKEELTVLLDRLNKKIYSSKTIIETYLKNKNTDKIEKEMIQLEQMVENSERLHMR